MSFLKKFCDIDGDYVYRPVTVYLHFRGCKILLPLQRHLRIGTSPACDIILEEDDGVTEFNTCMNLTSVGVLVTNLAGPGGTRINHGQLATLHGQFVRHTSLISFGEERAMLMIDRMTCKAMRYNVAIASARFPNLCRPCCNRLHSLWRIPNGLMLVYEESQSDSRNRIIIQPFKAKRRAERNSHPLFIGYLL